MVKETNLEPEELVGSVEMELLESELKVSKTIIINTFTELIEQNISLSFTKQEKLIVAKNRSVLFAFDTK